MNIGGQLITLLMAISFATVPASNGQVTRVANQSLAMPSAPPVYGYAVQQAFGHSFSAPVALATPPGETKRLFVVEQTGRIKVISDVTAASPAITTFLDIQDRVLADNEQ